MAANGDTSGGDNEYSYTEEAEHDSNFDVSHTELEDSTGGDAAEDDPVSKYAAQQQSNWMLA